MCTVVDMIISCHQCRIYSAICDIIVPSYEIFVYLLSYTQVVIMCNIVKS